jgi:hypothetical protein
MGDYTLIPTESWQGVSGEAVISHSHWPMGATQSDLDGWNPALSNRCVPELGQCILRAACEAAGERFNPLGFRDSFLSADLSRGASPR